MPQTAVRLKDPRIAALLAWLIPGGGHLYQGRTGKGLLYMVCILSLFFLGLAMGEGNIVYWRWVNPLNDPENFRFSYVCQFWVGLPSLPGVIQATLKAKGMDPVLWGYLAEPQINAINALHPKLGKLVEVGWVYTVIAGLLNVLAIYDAYEGPAYGEEEEQSAASAQAETEAVKEKEAEPARVGEKAEVGA
jgi:hypothetical protein